MTNTRTIFKKNIFKNNINLYAFLWKTLSFVLSDILNCLIYLIYFEYSNHSALFIFLPFFIHFETNNHVICIIKDKHVRSYFSRHFNNGNSRRVNFVFTAVFQPSIHHTFSLFTLRNRNNYFGDCITPYSFLWFKNNFKAWHFKIYFHRGQTGDCRIKKLIN